MRAGLQAPLQGVGDRALTRVSTGTSTTNWLMKRLRHPLEVQVRRPEASTVWITASVASGCQPSSPNAGISAVGSFDDPKPFFLILTRSPEDRLQYWLSLRSDGVQ